MGGLPRPRGRPLRLPRHRAPGRVHPHRDRARPDRPPRSGRRCRTRWSTSWSPTTTAGSTWSVYPNWSPGPPTSGRSPNSPTPSPSCARLAEVCDLELITDVLDSAEGFDLLSLGDSAFIGRAGEKLWDRIGRTVVERWDEVIDALDGIVTTPDVDQALVQAQAELAERERRRRQARPPSERGNGDPEPRRTSTGPGVLGRVRHRLHLGHRRRPHRLTLRCYLGDEPGVPVQVGRIQLFSCRRAGELYRRRRPDHALANIEVFGRSIRDGAAAGDLAVAVAGENTYILDGSHAAVDPRAGGGAPAPAGPRGRTAHRRRRRPRRRRDRRRPWPAATRWASW